jgi:predicted RNA-binding Zn-ribbon protein involved in translation (DUF1610 family)
MHKDTHTITVACESCGHEFQQQIGWLRKRAGRTDFICPACGKGFKDYTKQLEFIAGDDASKLAHKLRLHPL